MGTERRLNTPEWVIVFKPVGPVTTLHGIGVVSRELVLGWPSDPERQWS